MPFLKKLKTKRLSKLSKPRTALFIAAFALIGAYLIFASFASYYDTGGEGVQYNDINNTRAQYGRAGIGYSACLSSRARAWAQYVAQNGLQEPGQTRLANDAQSCYRGSPYFAAYNTSGPMSSSQQAFDCFMQECGYAGTTHRDNILDTRDTVVGTGVYVDDSGYYHVAQLFVGCPGCNGDGSAPGTYSPPPPDPLPRGYVDQAVEPNICHFQGWAVDDSDTNNQIPIHIYVNGQFVSNPSTSNHWWYANVPHNGVGNHGFDIPLPENYRDGRGYSYLIYAINIPDPNKNTLLKSGTVVCDPLPVGHLDSTSGGHFSGWAFDRSQIDNQIPVHLYVNGNFVANPNTSNHWWYANTYRPDVGGAFTDLQNTPHGAYHGFDIDASGYCSSGTLFYKLYAINIYNINANTLVASGSTSCSASTSSTTTATTSAPAATTANAIVGVGSNRCIDLPYSDTTNGNQLVIYTCNGTPNQLWKFNSDGTIHSSLNNNKCIDLNGSNTNNGNKIQIWDCNGSKAQKWTYGSDKLIRSTLNSNKVFDITGGSTANSAKIQIWDYNGGYSNQLWIKR